MVVLGTRLGTGLSSVPPNEAEDVAPEDGVDVDVPAAAPAAGAADVDDDDDDVDDDDDTSCVETLGDSCLRG